MIKILYIFIILKMLTLPKTTIERYLEDCNVCELIKYFNTNIEMSILNKQDIYSKKQAKIILNDFFSKNIPYEIKIIHQTKNNDLNFFVGKIVTSTGNYIISILIKKNKEPLIYQFKIEKEYTTIL